MPRLTGIQCLCIKGRDRNMREMLRIKLLGNHSNTGSDLRSHLFWSEQQSIEMKSRQKEKKRKL